MTIRNTAIVSTAIIAVSFSAACSVETSESIHEQSNALSVQSSDNVFDAAASEVYQARLSGCAADGGEFEACHEDAVDAALELDEVDFESMGGSALRSDYDACMNYCTADGNSFNYCHRICKDLSTTDATPANVSVKTEANAAVDANDELDASDDAELDANAALDGDDNALSNDGTNADNNTSDVDVVAEDNQTPMNGFAGASARSDYDACMHYCTDDGNSFNYCHRICKDLSKAETKLIQH